MILPPWFEYDTFPPTAKTRLSSADIIGQLLFAPSKSPDNGCQLATPYAQLIYQDTPGLHAIKHLYYGKDNAAFSKLRYTYPYKLTTNAITSNATFTTEKSAEPVKYEQAELESIIGASCDRVCGIGLSTDYKSIYSPTTITAEDTKSGALSLWQQITAMANPNSSNAEPGQVLNLNLRSNLFSSQWKSFTNRTQYGDYPYCAKTGIKSNGSLSLSVGADDYLYCAKTKNNTHQQFYRAESHPLFSQNVLFFFCSLPGKYKITFNNTITSYGDLNPYQYTYNLTPFIAKYPETYVNHSPAIYPTELTFEEGSFGKINLDTFFTDGTATSDDPTAEVTLLGGRFYLLQISSIRCKNAIKETIDYTITNNQMDFEVQYRRYGGVKISPALPTFTFLGGIAENKT